MLKESLFKENLNISIDSESFQDLLLNKNKNAEIILEQLTSSENVKYFEIIRSPLETDSPELLKKIPYFTIKETQDSKLRYGMNDLSALYTHNPLKISEHPNNILSYSQIRFTRKISYEIGKRILNKSDLNEAEINAMKLMIIQPYLKSNAKIFITENPLILKCKEKFYHIIDYPPIIVNLEIAKEIIGLYMRYKNNYDININSDNININFPINKHEFYENSLLLKISNLPFRSDNFGDLTKPLINRFLYLLMSLDEIGIQHYNGTDRTSMFNSLYHFNYFLSLITGIFDNLAIITKNKYEIFAETNNDITLNPKNSKKIILKGIKQKNESLYKHLVYYSEFIGLIHELRNTIMHNEMLENGAFHKNPYVVAKGVKIPNKIFKKLKMCPNDLDKSKKHEFWGVLTVDSNNNGYVDLFKFTKSSCIELFRFTNTYMELIGQNNFIMVLKKEKSSYPEFLELFEKNKFDLVL